MFRYGMATVILLASALTAPVAVAFEQPAGTSARVEVKMPLGAGAKTGPHLQVQIRNTSTFSDKPPWETRERYDLPETADGYAPAGSLGLSDYGAVEDAARAAAAALPLSGRDAD